jgi:hypothetical protein
MLRRSNVMFFAAILLCGSALWAQSPPAKPQKAAEPKLAAVCKSALNAIESNRPKQLIPLIAEKGIVLGTGSQPTPKSSLLEQIGKRQGFYCRLFDSTCLQNGGAKEQVSYRRAIHAAGSVYATCMQDAHDERTGTLLIILDRRSPQRKNLTLAFTLEKQQWKLSGLPEY